MRQPFRHFLVLPALGWLVAVGGACRSQTPSGGQPEYAPTATVKDIMEAVIDPSADVLWHSVSTVVDQDGDHQQVPQNDEEWDTARFAVIRLVEGGNLLMMPGRHVARPHERSKTPGIELEPEQIEANIAKDREKWIRLAKAFQATSAAALQAIDSRNEAAITDAGEKLDAVCENCHSTYWYPNQPLPPGYRR